MKLFKNKKNGWTILELVLIIVVISLAIFFIILFTSYSLQETRDSRRWADLNVIMRAVYENAIDEDGYFHKNIPVKETEICRYDASSCEDLVDLSFLIDEGLYLYFLPVDPLNKSLNGTGYTIYKDAFNRISLQAPLAERNELIILFK